MGSVCRLCGDLRLRLRVRHEYLTQSKGYQRYISQKSSIRFRIRRVPNQSRTLSEDSERFILPITGLKVLGFKTDAE